MPGCTNPRTELHPLRLVVDMDTSGGGREQLALNQLSGGYGVLLALVIDLARRMAQANPHLGAAAIDASGVVLIDEVDLHLHPRWQQRILPDLLRAFRNIQFIVTTHSPQVLTTVQPHQIVILERQAAKITAATASSSYGAESGRLLEEILSVDQRPPEDQNEFTEKLHRYGELVAQNAGVEDDALQLRRELDAISPRDPGLIRLDMEIRRRREIELTDTDRQVEHFYPKSDTTAPRNWSFEPINLLAACKGGTNPHSSDPARRALRPSSRSRSCGEAKEGKVLDGSDSRYPKILKPTELPAFPRLFEVLYDGRIRPRCLRPSGHPDRRSRCDDCRAEPGLRAASKRPRGVLGQARGGVAPRRR